MSCRSFYKNHGHISLNEIIDLTGAKVSIKISGDQLINNVSHINGASQSDITFLSQKKYLNDLKTSAAGFCLVNLQITNMIEENSGAYNCIFLEVDDPKKAISQILSKLYPDALNSIFGHTDIKEDKRTNYGNDKTNNPMEQFNAHQSSVVSMTAQVGEGSFIGANSFVGDMVSIGKNCQIGHNVVITNAIIGDNVIILSGAAIGNDGFGYYKSSSSIIKVPHIGRVIIQDNVDIGANTAIDRGMIDDTVIGEGTKIDNLCQVGHNTVIGTNCLIVANTAIAGSVTIGDNVIIAGKSGVADHINIGDNATICAGSSVLNDISSNEQVMGYPAINKTQFYRNIVKTSKLGDKQK